MVAKIKLTTSARWTNRRRMAWLALIAGLFFPVLLLFTESDQLGAISGPFYIFVGAVVGAYIGFATVDDKWQNTSENTDQTAMGMFSGYTSVNTTDSQQEPPRQS